MTNGHTAAVEGPSEASGNRRVGGGRAAPSGRGENTESMLQLGLKWVVRVSQLPVGKDIATKNRKLEVWALSM